MPCDYVRPNITPEKRKAEVKDALAKLERALALGDVTLKVGPTGSIAFVGWDKARRNGVTDLCAYRKLLASGSADLRKAQARAEALSGTKVNPRAIATGEHSHDEGKTWGKDKK